MLTPRTHNRYISGWCLSSMHQRCAGSYAGTVCACACHTGLQPAEGGKAARPSGRAR